MTTSGTDSQTPSRPRSFNGINHLKLPSTCIRATMDFYTKVLPFTYAPQYDHFTPDGKLFAQMCIYEPHRLIVEVRYEPEHAARQKGWDPITWGVNTRKDLEEWGSWLDMHGVNHSKILTGIKGWLMACEDPDGRIVRLYVDEEEHEWTNHPDRDDYWLGVVKGDPAFSLRSVTAIET